MKTDSGEELNIGDRVLYKDKDGKFYEGIIESIDEELDKVEVKDIKQYSNHTMSGDNINV